MDTDTACTRCVLDTVYGVPWGALSTRCCAAGRARELVKCQPVDSEWQQAVAVAVAVAVTPTLSAVALGHLSKARPKRAKC
jgi:hypothetical protein